MVCQIKFWEWTQTQFDIIGSTSCLWAVHSWLNAGDVTISAYAYICTAMVSLWFSIEYGFHLSTQSYSIRIHPPVFHGNPIKHMAMVFNRVTFLKRLLERISSWVGPIQDVTWHTGHHTDLIGFYAKVCLIRGSVVLCETRETGNKEIINNAFHHGFSNTI